MIPLVLSEHDDSEFLSLGKRILNGAITALQLRDVFLVQTDNWFDHKWLGWGSRWRHKKIEELRIPLFTPNRVSFEKHFLLDVTTSEWKSVGLSEPLHIHQPGRGSLAKPLDRFSKSAAFVWYSGNTTLNKMGSLMFYTSGANAHAWYASFRKIKHWSITNEFQITRHELTLFEERGLQVELAQV